MSNEEEEIGEKEEEFSQKQTNQKVSKEQQNEEKLIQNQIDQQNKMFTDFFQNEQEKALEKKQNKHNEITLTFYCYSTIFENSFDFRKNNFLKLIMYKDKNFQTFRRLEKEQEEYMLWIQQTKIFQVHIKLQDQNDIKYLYQLETYKDGILSKSIKSDFFHKSINSSGQIIFDTPYFDKQLSDSKLMLQSFTLLYAQKCSIIPAQFFSKLINFIKNTVEGKADQKNIIILQSNNEDFKSLKLINKIIYVGALQSQNILTNYQANFDYHLNIEETCLLLEEFKILDEEMKKSFGQGFQHLIKKYQLLEALQLPKEMRSYISEQTWNFQINVQPEQNLIEKIDFSSINQQLKDKLFSLITSLNNIRLIEILFYIKFIEPSVSSQIQSFNMYQQKQENKNLIKELVEYISQQIFPIQKQFILTEEFRLSAFQNENFIELGLDILENNKNQQISAILFEDIIQIAGDILTNLQSQNIIVFKNYFKKLLTILNQENVVDQKIVKELKSLIFRLGYEEFYQAILSIKFGLQNKKLEDTLIECMIEILDDAKKQNEYYSSFQKIVDSKMFINLNFESQEKFLVQLFDKITSLLPKDYDIIKLIDDQGLLDCLTLLKRKDLITSCVLPQQIIQYFDQLITNFNQKQIKLSNLRGLLQEDFKKIMNFLIIIGILQKADLLVKSLQQASLIQNQMIGLKQFLIFMEKLEIQNYKQIYDQVKDYFESHEHILLDQFIAKQIILEKYTCLEFLYKFQRYDFVSSYIEGSLCGTNQLNRLKSDIDLNCQIMNLINQIKNHLNKINNYKTYNDNLSFQEVQRFWSYTFTGKQALNQNEIFQFIDQLQNYYNKNEKQNLTIQLQNDFFSDIIDFSTFFSNIAIIMQICGLTQIIEFKENYNNQSNIIHLKNEYHRICILLEQQNFQQNFIKLLTFMRYDKQKILKDILHFIPKNHRLQITEFISVVEKKKELIQYLKQLEQDKINLEDLVDVIDETSMETDALVQEMMNVKNALQLLRQGEEDKISLIQCLVSRYQKYTLHLKNNQKLESTIDTCVNQLEFIRLKIQSQSDRSRQLLQTIKNFEKQITVNIKRLENQSESQLLLSTSEIYQNFNKDHIFNFDDFNLLCNRFKLIQSNKHKNYQQQQEQLDEENPQETNYNNLISVLQMSEQIRLTLDNLKYLGYSEFEDGKYIQKNSLSLIIPQLSKDLEQFKGKNLILVQDLTLARQKYLSLNFYPPYSFEIILKLKCCVYDENQSKSYLNQLTKLTLFINQNLQPNLNKFKSYIQESWIKNDYYGMNIYGEGFNILLNLPKVESVDNNLQLDKLTEGFQIECRRIKSYDLLSKSIISIFFAHQQKPTSWQIFFCSPKSKILDLEQFAYLAKNSIKHQDYKSQNPLFLICQFEKLPILVQRQFIDKLTEMYEGKEKINLLITYVGNFNEENSMHILQQYKYALQVNLQQTGLDLVKFSNLESLSKISLHLSSYSGFGKTYQINKRCKKNNQKLIEIPIYGETTQLELIILIQQKLQCIENFNQYRLHLNIYDLKSDDIHSILFQLLILRKLSYLSQFALIPPQMVIEIEIQNTFLDVLENKLQYLKEYISPNNIFKYDLKTVQIQKPVSRSINGADLELFEIIDHPNIKYEDIQLSFQYLKNITKLSSFQIKNFEKVEQLKEFLKNNQVNQIEIIQLIKDHFLYQLSDNFSFYHINCILKFFCKQVILFHKTVYLNIENLKYQEIDLNLRVKVFEGIIKTSVPYSCQIMSNNYLSQEQEIGKRNLPYFDTLDQRNKNIRGWDDNLGQADDFFLTISQSGSILPIFQKIQSVPNYLIKYCNSIKSKIQDWNDLENIQDTVLINLCTSAKNVKKVKQELLQKYSDIAITKSIARKICFLYIKINSDIPTLIMGETGVGKTIIVKYLSSLINSLIFTLDVHAGITQNEIIKWVNSLIKISYLDMNQCEKKIKELDSVLLNDPQNEILNQEKNQVTQFYEFKMNQQNEGKCDFSDQKIILFLDEINTNQNIDGILKELLVEKKIQGEPLPDNFVTIAAANPYKFKTERDQQGNTDSLKISSCQNQQTSKLVYHVYPLAESMNTFIWQFGELLPEDEIKIVTQMVKNASQGNIQLVQFNQTLIQTIVGSQEFTRINQSIRSVSLRDVSRFLKIFKYFKTDPAWNANLQDSLLLTVFFIYYSRFNNIKIRGELCSYLENTIKVSYGGQIIPFTQNLRITVNKQMEQIQGILEYGDLYKSIAFTSTLKENLFMILISILNNIPIIMVGPPGSSKTLCTRLLYNSMKGSKSNIDFFKKLPNLIYKTYQCSALSTSESIEKAFKQAKQLENSIRKSSNETKDGDKNIVALILDEIGLSEASKSNPLKILHRLLEYQQNVPMIGLSNWSLDASKMNRVIFCNRPKLSEEELIEAAIAIQRRINPYSENCYNIAINLAKDSFSYFSQDNNKTFFHGTRDFYNCVTQICNNLKNHNQQIQNIEQKIILAGILRNFGGQREINETLAQFKLSLGQTAQQLYDQSIDLFNATELIQMNINDKNCRNLMIIANKPDYALQYTEILCKDRLYKVFQGSDLYDDFKEYNTLKMLNEIITCIEEGYLVIMYNLESLYQSFYDLFNQNYVALGSKQFCRIAIGSDSIRSQVHQNFKAIIIAQSDDVYDQRQNYDPPLLNRFEKQYIELKFLLKQNEVQIKKELSQFIQNSSEIKPDRRLQLQWNFGIQDMFPIIYNENKDEFMISLTLKNNDENNDLKRITKSCYELINLANFSGVIRAHFLKKLDSKFYDYYLKSSNHFQFRDILDKLSNQKKDEINGGEFNSQLSENLIIYTNEYKYQYDNNQSIKQKNYMELEVKWLESIENLKEQVKQFFYSDLLVNLIVISSISDSIAKLLYIKRILQEERQLYEFQQQHKQQEKRNKNLILVIQLINQHTKFVGFSFDKIWQQIYIEDTSTPQNKQDDLQNYLQPIRVVLKNQNGIYHSILQECFPKIFGYLNFEKQDLTKEEIKQRLQKYMQVFQMESDQDLNLFTINKIIERIDKKCEIISKIYGKCEWYQLVSLMYKEKRNNNKFISSLIQFIYQESLAILTKMFYVAEKNNIISSLMCDKLTFSQQNLNQIIQIWLQTYDELSEDDKLCYQIQFIQYPFLSSISQQMDQFKQLYLEKINKIFQIEERKQIRLNGESYEENINDLNNTASNIQKKQKQNMKEIIKILINQTQINGDQLMNISQINPLLYFENLHYQIEYQWTECNTVQRITKKIIEILGEEQTAQSFHSILWVNEQIFTELYQVWKQCQVKDHQIIFEQIYQKFEEKLKQILQNHLSQIKQENQILQINQEVEDKNDDQEDLNILELIWSEILIFSSNLLEVFIISKDQENLQNQQQHIQKLDILKNCLGIIYNCSSAYELFPEQMIQLMSKFNFILKISQCFTQSQNFKSLIQQQLYDQNYGLEFINIENYQKIKQSFIDKCDKQKENELVLRLIWQLLKCDCFNDKFFNFNDEILKEIIESLSNILQLINYDNISKNQVDSHYFIFTKRILQKIVTKMYESFDENDEKQIENLLQPECNESFKKMQKIFEQLNIQKINPICSLISDIIKEYNYYTPKKFLSYIAKKQYEDIEVFILEAKVEKVGKFLQRINQNSQNKTLLNIIEFKIIQELCQTICKFIKEEYLFNKREEPKYQQVKQIIEQNYNQDRVRKNRLIQILNKTLLLTIQKNDEINPILPIVLVKILKEIFNFKNLSMISPYLEAFQNEIFLEQCENENIWDEGQLGIEFKNDLKINKKLLNLQNIITKEEKNYPVLQFNLTKLISEIIIDQNKQDFDLMIKILSQSNLKFIDTNLIKEIQTLYFDLLQFDKNIPLELQQLFITNLIMTTFLNQDSFISKMYNGKIEIESIFVPFMVDSDAILQIQDELKKTTAIRRYQCKNCIQQKIKPYIYTILPCCMPNKNLAQCPQCRKQPRMEDHYSPDIEPPQTIQGKQEPIFVKDLKDYEGYANYYKKPNFPYTYDVQTINSFIQNRGRIDLVVKNYLEKQSLNDFTDKLCLSEDQNRIQFEIEFVDNILEAKELVNIKQIIQKKQVKQNNKNKDIIFNCRIDLLQDQFSYLKEYKHLLRLNQVIQQENFQRFIILDSDGIQSEFFKKLIYLKEQINICSQIQPIQNFIKLFNLKMFDKITRKESTEIKMQQFVKDNHLEEEFKQFKQSWNYMKQQIHVDNIQIGVDCARIELDEVESEQQKIDILCYSEDQASRGYPLYLLIKYFQVQYNNFLESLEQDFGQLFSKFQCKKFITMNKKNFIPPNIFSNSEEQNEFADKFFNDYIERQSGHNPYLEYERQEIYDLNELTCDFIEDYYQNVTKIQQTSKSDLDKVQLVNFRFKGDQKAINLVREISLRVKQQIYPEIQNDPSNPLLFINLQNKETCKKLIDILKTTMQIIAKINGTKLNDLQLLEMLDYFEISAQDINFTKEKIKLCHLVSIYELVERISFETLFQDIHPLFQKEINQSQKDVLKQFCDQQHTLQVDIFQQAIGRMVVRILCEQNIQIKPEEPIFQLFQTCEEFEEFLGIEHKTDYKNQIINSDWSQKYSIFKSQNPDVIILSQAYNMYREIQMIKDQKHKQEIESRNNQLKKEQIDLEMIQQEQLQENKFLVQPLDKKKKIQQKNNKSFK
ncbi:hypothetical protein ABPG74_009957 [Tetrahymena malaccensis]